jgi:O-antigen/teichoic acid export membrane protein
MGALKEEHRTVAKGAFWGLLGGLALKFVSFIYTIFLGRFFSQNSVGTFYLSFSIASLFTIFSDFGMNSAFNRYVPFYIGKGQKKDVHALLDSAYLFSSFLSIIISLVLFFAAGPVADFYGNSALAAPLKWMGFFLLVNNFFSLNTSFLVGLKKIKENTAINNAQNILKLLLTLILYFLFGDTAYVIAMGFVLSFLVLTIISFFYVKKGLAEVGAERSPSTLGEKATLIKEVLPFGLTITLIATFWQVATYVDRLMIGYLIPNSADDIAVYSIAIGLAWLLPVFSSAISSIFFPLISEMQGKEDQEGIKQISSTATRWVIFLTVPITILLITFPKELLSTFYGSAYSSGATVVMIFAAGLFIRRLTDIQGNLLASKRILKVELSAAVVAMVFNVILNWMLIPTYGIAGSAFASATSFLLVSLIIDHYSRKLAGFGFSREFLKPLFAGALALLFVFLMRGYLGNLLTLQLPSIGEGLTYLIAKNLLKLFILGLLFLLICALYFVLLLVSSSFHKEDAELLAGIMRKIRMPEGFVSLSQRLIGRDELV